MLRFHLPVMVPTRRRLVQNKLDFQISKAIYNFHHKFNYLKFRTEGKGTLIKPLRSLFIISKKTRRDFTSSSLPGHLNYPSKITE